MNIVAQQTDDSGHRQALLKRLPGVDRLLHAALQDMELSDAPKSVLTARARDLVASLRRDIMNDNGAVNLDALSTNQLMARLKTLVQQSLRPNLTRVINATGIVVHTNLGRSLLAQEAIAHVMTAANRYSNLEYNLETGKRGLRYAIVEDILCDISGAQAAMVVNNNAAAVLLCLDTIAAGREVIVSRGELVEIGGSFRIPDVMARSGAILKEVGTTNRTHLRDYEDAIGNNTSLLLKVHTSNFGIVGFTASVSLRELVEMGGRHGLPVMEDLGSGTFIDFSRHGLQKEPTVRESVRAGADIVTFSGDKLLGGPQAGIILGKPEFIAKIRKNPLTRALRIDKLTLAALEGTLRLYRDEPRAIAAIPTLAMLTCPMDVIHRKALNLKSKIDAHNAPRLQAEILETMSMAGGGALPLMGLPSRSVGVRIQNMSASALENHMRRNTPPIIGRIESDRFILDMRTVQDDELPDIDQALIACLKGSDHAAPN